jgi:two-component system, OmpR family, response regulator
MNWHAGHERRKMRVVNSPDRSDAADAQEQRDDRPLLYIVDDDVATLELLSEVALEAGWTATGFLRLAGLRAALDRRIPELMILDDDLPDGRGGDLARELHENPRMTDVPLLVCTAAHPMRQAEIGSWAPVVSKPFDVREVEGVLEAVARGQQREHRSYGRAG